VLPDELYKERTVYEVFGVVSVVFFVVVFGMEHPTRDETALGVWYTPAALTPATPVLTEAVRGTHPALISATPVFTEVVRGALPAVSLLQPVLTHRTPTRCSPLRV
jgi:hypothetical protein